MALLRRLSVDDWERPTAAGGWRVRHVVAHMLDTALRRLSFHRDHQTPPPPRQPIASDRDFVEFINALNAEWIQATNRLSPRALRNLYAHAGLEMAEFFEGLPLDAPALFPVSWAGEAASAGWLDVGRELTEVWHHGAQIRDAVGEGPYSDPRWLRAVLEIAMHGLPHAYREVRAGEGQSVALDVTGASGGRWTLRFAGDRWDIGAPTATHASVTATLSDDTAWRLLFNGLTESAAESLVRFDGDIALGHPLLRARSVIV